MLTFKAIAASNFGRPLFNAESLQQLILRKPERRSDRRQLRLTKIDYAELNARQKENYNFQKISAVLADYGFTSIRLSDDWHGADFLALHVSGETLKIQLKSRLTFDAKYRKKDLWVCFPYRDSWYLYPHDELLEIVLKETTIEKSCSWSLRGNYSIGLLGRKFSAQLEKYRISDHNKASVNLTDRSDRQ